VLLTVSISVPVRRLTAATRRIAAGDRTARAPRGGSAEIDELATQAKEKTDKLVPQIEQSAAVTGVKISG
jgi:methyl-accepting chemotaxis protein